MKLDEKTPAVAANPKSRPFGSTLTDNHLNTTRQEIHPTSKTPSIVKSETSSSSTAQKLPDSRPTAVKFSLDDEDNDSEDAKNTTKPMHTDQNYSHIPQHGEDGESKKNDGGTEFGEEFNSDMFDDIDVDEAFCTRRAPGLSFDPHKDDPIALVAERVKLLQSDRKKYSMESDYLDSDFFDGLDDDDVPDWKKIHIDVDTDKLMQEIATLELNAFLKENLGVIPDFMKEDFAELEEELIEEGLIKVEDEEDEDEEDDEEGKSGDDEDDLSITGTDDEEMEAESVVEVAVEEDESPEWCS